MQLNPNMKKCPWPWSLFPEADLNRVNSVYPVTKNRFKTGGGQVSHNKLWSRWNVTQVTPNMKNISDPDLFFQRRIGNECVQYTQWLKIVSRPEAGRFHVTSSDPDAEETQQARLRAEKMCTSEKRNTCKKMDLEFQKRSSSGFPHGRYGHNCRNETASDPGAPGFTGIIVWVVSCK